MILTKENFQRLSNKNWRLNHLYKIVDKQKRLVVFKEKEVQRKFNNSAHTRNIILKSRQRGFTTNACIDGLDDVLFNKNFKFTIIADTLEHAEEIFEKIQIAWKHFPLRDFYQANTENTREISFNNGSTVKVTTDARSATVNRLHICLSGDTKILLQKGFTKKIKDIQVGDYVLNGNGSYSKVKQIIKNKISDLGEKMYGIKSFGSYEPLKLTENHQILTREPKRKLRKSTGKYVWKKAKDIRRGDYIAYPCRNFSGAEKDLSFGDKRIKLDYDLGFLCGLYCAEGYLRRKEITFALDKDEIPSIKKVVERFKDYFDSYRIDYSKKSRTACVVIYGKGLADFLRKYFGEKKDKFISDSIWHYGRNFIDGVIFGYFYGDGCFKNNSEISIVSTRLQLLNQLKLLLISLRYGYPTIYNQKAGEHYHRNCQEVWTLKLNGAGNWKFRKRFNLKLPKFNTFRAKWNIENKRNPSGRKLWRRGKKVYWSRITDIKEIKKEEFIYDIVLEGEHHHFTTINGVVHNSELGKIGAKYPKKANDIITGSIPAVPKDGRVDIESTAEGEVGLFYELCQQFIDTKPQSPFDFKFHFFGWLDDDDCSLEGDIEVPADLREYQRKHQIPENKIKWYAQQRKILLDKIKQEYPTYAEEAFIYSGEKFFDSELIINLKKLAKEGKVEGSWIYYQNYIPGHYYGLGADVSEGIGKASNTIVIWDFTPDKPKVVAEYENKNIAPDLFAYEIKNGGEKYGMAVVAPERNNPGHATITELKKIYPEKNIYKYKITDRVNDLTTEKLGWETNLVTKPKMLYEFRRAVYDDLVEIPSRLILKEMGTYNTNDLLTTKRDEEMTEHWDRLVAAAIGFQMRNFIITKESSQATQYRPNLRRYNVRR